MDPVTMTLLYGGAQAIGTIAQASAAKQQAAASFPEAYQQQLNALRERQKAGMLGLSEGQRTQMETQGTAARAGLTAQAQARQLQQASAASGSPVSGRDLFQQELALQNAMAQAQTQEAAAINQADQQQRQMQQQQLMELQQRKADAEAARRIANRQMLACLALNAGKTGALAYGGSQMSSGYQAMAAAAQGSGSYADAVRKVTQGQMAMGMAGVYAGPPLTSAPQASRFVPSPDGRFYDNQTRQYITR